MSWGPFVVRARYAGTQTHCVARLIGALLFVRAHITLRRHPNALRCRLVGALLLVRTHIALRRHPNALRCSINWGSMVVRAHIALRWHLSWVVALHCSNKSRMESAAPRGIIPQP